MPITIELVGLHRLLNMASWHELASSSSNNKITVSDAVQIRNSSSIRLCKKIGTIMKADKHDLLRLGYSLSRAGLWGAVFAMWIRLIIRDGWRAALTLFAVLIASILIGVLMKHQEKD
jgi:phosphotransferase system  glucose/maltose/N-acetylglucosamine-specific IIC component